MADGFQGTLPPRGDYELLDVVMKRNLVFASWRRADDGATGTWILSWDREGRLAACTSA